MKKIVLLAFVSVLLLTMTIAYKSNVFAWSNGGYSDDPSNPDYGTHDWIAEHALDWLPEEEKRYIADNLAAYRYGTELPDNATVPGGIGDKTKHHVYYWSNGSLQEDDSAVRAYEEYNNTLNFLRLGDLVDAAKTAGVMSHYIVEVAVFGHVMGAVTDWGAEEQQHHSGYETYVNQRTDSYDDEFNVYLSFDGDLALISAYDATKELAYDTTFDVDGDLTCVWMDQNYNWSDPVFKNRCGESLNLAVNYLTDVLHTLYLEAASVHNIDTGLDYLTIQEAINAPKTLNGHTILVDAGIHYEHVTVNKSISLVGEDRDATIIDGNGTGSVISVTRSNVTITGFSIRNGSNGIDLNFPGVGQCRNITICNNLITDMGGCGILVLSSDSNRIVRNTILNSWVGINLGPSYSNIVSQNIISNNKRKGIASGLIVVPIFSRLNSVAVDSNKILENLIVDNGCGINITNRGGEIILHNNFLNNTVQAYVLQQYGIKATNIWDNGFEGNYWSDYNGTDFLSGPYRNETGSDGIGDTAYTIDVNNQDNYPLMGMFSDFNATSEYHVQTICNSSISDFQFNGTAICFNVTGENDTTGFCRICIPRALMNETYKVFVNGTEVSHTLLLCSNGTHSYLYFTYNHSTQEVVIVPEFPTWTSMLLILIVLTVAIAICKRRLFCCS